MQAVTSFLTEKVDKAEYDDWLASYSPLTGQLHAFVCGLALGAVLLHEERFGLEWERRSLMYRLQAFKHPLMIKCMWFLGQFASADFLVPYFAFLYWTLDQEKCIYGVWLVPICELSNGILKWLYRVPRPGWVDNKIKMRAWSNEFSFPSSHAQMIWALSVFFHGTSSGTLRTRLWGDSGHTALAYFLFLIGPYVLAVLVSISRVYEGVHYPRDVLVGSGLGVTIAGLYVRFLPFIIETFGQWSSVDQMLLLLVMTALWLAGSLYTHNSLQPSTTDKRIHQWQQTANKVGTSNVRTIAPFAEPLSSYVGMCGVILGLSIGIPTRHLVPLELPTSLQPALVRLIVGNVVLLGIYFAIRVVEKRIKGAPVMQRVVRLIRYASVPINILLLVPLVFNMLAM